MLQRNDQKQHHQQQQQAAATHIHEADEGGVGDVERLHPRLGAGKQAANSNQQEDEEEAAAANSKHSKQPAPQQG